MTNPAAPAQSIVELLTERHGARALHDALTPEERTTLRYCWRAWARPCVRRDVPPWIKTPPGYGVWSGQTPPPGDWMYWLLMMGRAGGKTWTGSNWLCEQAQDMPLERSAMVGATSADSRRTMLKGKAGVLRMAKPWFFPRWYHTDQTLIWPNGHVTTLYTADEPGRLRGPEHAIAWADEVCAWSNPEAWDMLQMTMRGGRHPRVLVTTTPNSSRIIRDLIASPETALSIGSTAENARNLPPAFLARLLKKYEGTRLGRQELQGELVEDADGALWTRALIEAWRVDAPPSMRRIVVAVDPSASSKGTGALCGLVVAGVDDAGDGYVLADLSGQMTPDEWARKAAAAVAEWRADRLVYEVNHGGALVEQVLRTVDPNLPLLAVNASKGKWTRAEPVVALYEQGRVHHVREADGKPTRLDDLEDQMCGWTPDARGSPDRMDALVYALTELMLEQGGGLVF